MKGVFKLLSPIIVSLVIGLICGKVMFNQYTNTLKTVSNEFEIAYFIQQGVYSNYENMIENTKNIESFVYTEENNNFFVFLSITKQEKNKEKLLNYYKNQKIEVLAKEYKISNIEFINYLNSSDELLLNTTDTKAINSIINQVLNKYKETLIK